MEGENLEKLSNNNFVKVKSGFRVYYIIISIVILLVIGLSILYYIKYTQQQTQIQLFNNQMTKLNINVKYVIDSILQILYLQHNISHKQDIHI